MSGYIPVFNPTRLVTNSERIKEPNEDKEFRQARDALMSLSVLMARLRIPGITEDAIEKILVKCALFQFVLKHLINEDDEQRHNPMKFTVWKDGEWLTTMFRDNAIILDKHRQHLTSDEARYLYGKLYDIADMDSSVDRTRLEECHELVPGLVFLHGEIYQSPNNLLYYHEGEWSMATSQALQEECVKQIDEAISKETGQTVTLLERWKRYLMFRTVKHYNGRLIAPGAHIPSNAILVILPIEVIFDIRTTSPEHSEASKLLIQAVRTAITTMHQRQ